MAELPERVRTTAVSVETDSALHGQTQAAEQRRPLRALVEEGWRLVLKQPRGSGQRRVVRLVTVKGGLSPDFDLSDRDSMMKWVDKRK